MKCKDGGECGVGGYCENCHALGASRAEGANSNAGLERTPITEEEYTALIIASNHDEFLSCSFGHGVSLLPVADNKWAFEFLANMRSNGQGNGLAATNQTMETK